jgi:hypothetical protein
MMLYYMNGEEISEVDAMRIAREFTRKHGLAMADLEFAWRARVWDEISRKSINNVTEGALKIVVDAD